MHSKKFLMLKVLDVDRDRSSDWLGLCALLTGFNPWWLRGDELSRNGLWVNLFLNWAAVFMIMETVLPLTQLHGSDVTGFVYSLTIQCFFRKLAFVLETVSRHWQWDCWRLVVLCDQCTTSLVRLNVRRSCLFCTEMQLQGNEWCNVLSDVYSLISECLFSLIMYE